MSTVRSPGVANRRLYTTRSAYELKYRGTPSTAANSDSTCSSAASAVPIACSARPENSRSRALSRSASRSADRLNSKSGVSVPSIRALVTCGANAVSSGSSMRSINAIACCALATVGIEPSAASRWNSATPRCSRSTRWIDRPVTSRVPRMRATGLANTASASSGSSWDPTGENRLSRRSNCASTGRSPPSASTSSTASKRR